MCFDTRIRAALRWGWAPHEGFSLPARVRYDWARKITRQGSAGFVVAPVQPIPIRAKLTFYAVKPWP